MISDHFKTWVAQEIVAALFNHPLVCQALLLNWSIITFGSVERPGATLDYAKLPICAHLSQRKPHAIELASIGEQGCWQGSIIE